MHTERILLPYKSPSPVASLFYIDLFLDRFCAYITSHLPERGRSDNKLVDHELPDFEFSVVVVEPKEKGGKEHLCLRVKKYVEELTVDGIFASLPIVEDNGSNIEPTGKTLGDWLTEVVVAADGDLRGRDFSPCYVLRETPTPRIHCFNASVGNWGFSIWHSYLGKLSESGGISVVASRQAFFYHCRKKVVARAILGALKEYNPNLEQPWEMPKDIQVLVRFGVFDVPMDQVRIALEDKYLVLWQDFPIFVKLLDPDVYITDDALLELLNAQGVSVRVGEDGFTHVDLNLFYSDNKYVRPFFNNFLEFCRSLDI